MKRLYLLRHAKSDWDASVARDFDRPLNRRGHKGARVMGREMRALGLEFDLVLASPAARVAETLEGVEEVYGRGFDARNDERIYLASVATLLAILRETGEGKDRVLMIGHNPGMEQLALLLTRGGKARDLMAAKFPTAALAEITLPIDHWRDLGEGEGTLARFIRPRDLDPALGPEE